MRTLIRLNNPGLKLLLASLVVLGLPQVSAQGWELNGAELSGAEGFDRPVIMIDGNSERAVKEYNLSRPESLEVNIRAESGTDSSFFVAFKKDWRPVIRIGLGSDVVYVNDNQYELEDSSGSDNVHEIRLTGIDWDSYVVGQVSVDGRTVDRVFSRGGGKAFLEVNERINVSAGVSENGGQGSQDSNISGTNTGEPGESPGDVGEEPEGTGESREDAGLLTVLGDFILSLF